MKLTRGKTSGTWWTFTLNDEEGTTFRISRPKCRCLSCEDLTVVVEDEEGTRIYEVYAMGDDIRELLCLLAEHIGENNG